MKVIKYITTTLLATIICAACKPKEAKEPALPSPIAADFTYKIQSISPAVPDDKNFVIVENTSGFLTKWTFEGANKTSSTKRIDSVYFGKKGTYKIKLETASKGGMSTVEKMITIEEDTKIPADFTITKVTDYVYSVKNTTVISDAVKWEFPNGTSSTEKTDAVETYIPYAGDNEIKLTAELVKGVFVTVVKTINVPTNDPSNPLLTDPILTMLTGGPSNPNGKTWVVSNAPKKTNVGAGADMSSSYYNWPDGFTEAGFVEGIYTNEFTFKYNQQYIPKNQNVTAGAQYAEAYFGIDAIGDWAGNDAENGTYNNIKVVDPNHVASAFIYKVNDWEYIKDKKQANTTGATIEFTTGSYIGWFTNQHKFFIVKITEDEMVLGHYYDDHAYTDSPANTTFSQTDRYNNHRTLTFNVKK
ncbi:MAG TPA: hypothetical protein VL947_02550 [Cytophagales bacterium]|nr:hypothetical protein [Cytophagales bacterium]